MSEIFKIKLHSVIDVITNSSTEIYVFQDASLSAFKELVDAMILTFKVPYSTEEMFGCDVFLDDTYYYVEGYREYQNSEETVTYETIGKIMDSILLGEIEKPEWMKEIENQTQRATSLYIIPKKPEFGKLSKQILNFLNSPSYDAEFEG